MTQAYVTMSDYGGRCLKAAKEIDEGELIIAGEPPLVQAINNGATLACDLVAIGDHRA